MRSSAQKDTTGCCARDIQVVPRQVYTARSKLISAVTEIGTVVMDFTFLNLAVCRSATRLSRSNEALSSLIKL